MKPSVLLPVLFTAVLACACHRARPCVVLVSIDSLRHDELDHVVGGRAVAPTLNALSKESLAFDWATAAAPWTTPSMMAVMTGMPPRAHGVSGYDRMLASSVPLLAQKFKAAGYRTAGFASAATLRPAFGFGAGFDVYSVDHFGYERVSSRALVRKVVAQLDEWKDGPFFVWVHLWDPHYNYNPPEKFDVFRAGEKPPTEQMGCLRWYENAVTPAQAEYLKRRYEGEVLFTDKFLGDLLAYFKEHGLEQNTVVAVMGDHGEAFLEHGWLTHVNRVDEPVVHVPILVRWPGHVAPRHDASVVSTAQVGRTLLALAGIDDGSFGLEPPLPLTPRATGDGADDVAMTETVRDACFTALVGHRYKYVVEHTKCAESLFDLEADPGEQHDLAATRTDLVAKYRSLLKERLVRLGDARIPQVSQPPDQLESLEKALQSIGYVGARKSGGAAAPDCAVAPGATWHPGMGERGGPVCPSDGAWRCVAG